MHSSALLFSHNDSGQPVRFRREILTEDDLIKGLRQYIRKNTIIPAFYAEISQDQDKHADHLSALKTAINSADFNAAIFDHPDCSNYLLYLIEHKQLPFWVGMSAYTYLMTLAQFTNRQPLREGEVKSPRNVTPTSMVNGQSLSEYGAQYLKMLAKELSEFNVTFDIDRATQYILSLPLLEQHLLVVQIHYPYEDKLYSYSVDNFLETTLVANNPLLKSGQRWAFNIPSYGLIQYVFSQISEKPLQMKPVFGALSEESRDDLHAKDQHPLLLSSVNVKSNIKYVHGTQCGQVLAWLHDLGHLLYGCLLSFDSREFIQADLLPMLNQSMQDILKINPDTRSGLTAPLGNLIFNVNDYNLTPLNYFGDIEGNFKRTISEIMFDHSGIYCRRSADLVMTCFLPALDNFLETISGHQKKSSFVEVVQRIRSGYQNSIDWYCEKLKRERESLSSTSEGKELRL